MTDHNLDDLIIGEPELHGGKSKSVLTMLALIVIIIIVGIVLYQLIMGGEETVPKPGEKKTELTSIVTHPVRHETMPRRREQIPEELQPIVREKLPASSTQGLGRSHTVSVSQTAPIRKSLPEKSIPTPVTESKPHTKTSTVSRRERPPKTTAHAPLKTKPSELFKRKEQKTKKNPASTIHNKEYFVQVGSFKRPPTKKFLDDMRAKGYHPLLVKSAGMIKVRIGPYPSYADAKATLPEIKEKLGIAGFVVRKK